MKDLTNAIIGFVMSVFAAIVVITVLFAPIYGYVNNIVELTQCDFSEPYKAEVVRGVGVVIPIVGIVTGFIDIED